jgi:phospholipase C
MTTRRKFLGSAAGAAALGVLPPGLRAAMAEAVPAGTGTIQDVEHVVIFMQENRSFDHYFGTLNGVRGFSDPRAIALPGGKPVWHQPHGGKEFTPFHLDTGETAAQCMRSLDHSWKASHDLWKDHDAWIPIKSEMTMGYFSRRDIPFYYALADAFTVCDAYYCSVFGPTSPNRLHLFSGTSGLTAGDDRWAVANPDEINETADPDNDTASFGAFTWQTFAEQLEAAGVSWRVYQEYDNYGDNALAYFRNFRRGGDSNLVARARSWARGSDRHNAKSSRGEHLVAAFARDVAADRLPQVSWIVAPYIMCEHPAAPPSYGEALTSQLLEALAANSEVWKKTAFILNYDENDGFFDHMPPPVPPLAADQGASTVDLAGEDYRGVPFGFGPRVPAIVVSPWTTGGFVNSEVFDHTSVLRFLEARFGVAAPNISPWRRAIAGDLTSVFDFRRTSPAGNMPDGGDGIRRADGQCRLPTAGYRSEDLPRQEPGQRPARPLPYAFEISGRLAEEGFALVLANTGRAGAAFRVSSALGGGPWHFAVEAGKSVTYALPRNGRYDFSVLGPNGYFRRFAGDADDLIDIVLQYNAQTGTLDGEIRNDGAFRTTLQRRDGYDPGTPATVTVESGQTREFRHPIAQNANWYELTFETAGGYLRQFAGHVETGAPSMSDPLFG